MFFKQYNYKPRTGSTSSQGSGSGIAGSPPKEETKTTSTNTTTAAEATGPAASAAAAGRRRSSASGDKFAGLQGLRRNSQDKAGWADQKPGQTGILGGMWNSFTKGN